MEEAHIKENLISALWYPLALHSKKTVTTVHLFDALPVKLVDRQNHFGTIPFQLDYGRHPVPTY